MKVLIRANHRSICLAIPTGLILNPLALRIGTQLGRRHCNVQIPTIPPASVKCLARELKRLKRRSGPLTLVEAQTANGETVIIQL